MIQDCSILSFCVLFITRASQVKMPNNATTSILDQQTSSRHRRNVQRARHQHRSSEIWQERSQCYRNQTVCSFYYQDFLLRPICTQIQPVVVLIMQPNKVHNHIRKGVNGASTNLMHLFACSHCDYDCTRDFVPDLWSLLVFKKVLRPYEMGCQLFVERMFITGG